MHASTRRPFTCTVQTPRTHRGRSPSRTGEAKAVAQRIDQRHPWLDDQPLRLTIHPHADWSDAQHTTMWTNALLGPPPEHVMNILGAAGSYPEIARRFVNGFTDPSDYQHWFLDPHKAQMYLATVASRQGGE